MTRRINIRLRRRRSGSASSKRPSNCSKTLSTSSLASRRLQPEQLASHYYLALVVRDQGNDAEAISMLEKLLQRFPDHAASNEALGGLLMSAQRYDEAERHLRNAIRLNPKLVKANYQ